ncbi:MAG: DUF4332 domain-containing protein, partial [Candidatus Thorarchaeota archaeon]
FANFLKEEKNRDLVDVEISDVDLYVEKIEKKQKASAKGFLYVLMNYFKFIDDEELLKHTANLREARTKKTRRIFPLKDFYQVNREHVQKLANIGIKNVEQMLEAGKTIKQRKELAQQLAIPEKGILELVELSDITRIGYVKSKLAKLYHSAGFDTPTKIAKFTAEELYDHFKQYIEKSGWDGMVPNPSDLENNIKSAKKLEEFVEK